MRSGPRLRAACPPGPLLARPVLRLAAFAAVGIDDPEGGIGQIAVLDRIPLI